MEGSPALPKLSKRDKSIAWTIWLILLACFAFSIYLAFNPWSVADPGGMAFGSSLRRATNIGGTGNCESLDKDRGIWSCAITNDSGYSDTPYHPFVLWESGDEGCWVAKEAGYDWSVTNGYTDCAGALDAIGLAYTDDPIHPLSERVKARALAESY